ncbi:MAG: hypothetical protein JWQ34_752 [Mucilaginibacter sp.]|nr:hypothetical protein [Mucilaginibacter sp.]
MGGCFFLPHRGPLQRRGSDLQGAINVIITLAKHRVQF